MATRPTTLPLEALEAVHGGGQGNCPDADGHVPERYGNYGGTWFGKTLTLSKNPCRRVILYDTYNMRNAGPNDWAQLLGHERAHARGWEHGEGSRYTNLAFKPKYKLTGK